MADITKCSNITCPLRYSCYRHNAPNGLWQSWCYFVPNTADEEVTCDYYINENSK